jgi:antitoxin component of MazEF toxin-antitoxin module
MMGSVTFTKRVARSGRGYLVWIPKDVVEYLGLDERTTIEVRILKLERAGDSE